jgi:hypothetical protein
MAGTLTIEAVERVKVRFLAEGVAYDLQPGQRVELSQSLADQLLEKIPGKVRVLSPLCGEADWPAECYRSEAKFGTQEARLYPLLNQTVRTPRGSGLLRQVFGGRAAVRLKDAPDPIYFLDPSEVRPAP